MPSPSRSAVHVNRPLTNISIHFTQDNEDFVADRAFQSIPVGKRSDEYYVYERADFFRDEMRERAPGTQSAGGGFDLGTANYRARYWALHRDLDEQVLENYDDPLDAEIETTEWLSLQALIRKERLWNDQYFVAGVWATDSVGVVAGGAAIETDFTFWSDYVNSTPIQNIRLARSFMKRRTGKKANIMIIGNDVFDVLMDHPDIVERINRGQTDGPALADLDSLARMFQMESIMVMGGVYNTAAKGEAENNVFIGGNHAVIAYRPPNPGRMTPAAGYTFTWTGMSGSGPQGQRIKRIPMDELEADRVEIGMAFDQKVVAPELGFRFQAALN
jgi:hypothetical protein